MSVFLFTLLLFSSLGGQNLQIGIDKIVADDRLAGASIGIDVMDLETGASIASFQNQLSLVPASTQKLITTALAVDVLGPDKSFATSLVAKGEIRDGVLYGDLIIRGAGDPTLGSEVMPGALDRQAVLQQWVAAVKAAGIESINGAVIGDDTHYGTAGVAMDWPWADLGNYYGAGSYGLNWHDNLYYLDLTQRQRIGSIPPIRQSRPDIKGLAITNELRTAARGSGDNAYIYGAPFNYQHFLRGTIPAGTGRFTIKGSIPDPAKQAATELSMALAKAGVSTVLPAVNLREATVRNAAAELVIHTHSSPNLQAIAQRTNFKSVNLYAETLLRELNKSWGGENHEIGTTEFLMSYLSDELGLNTRAVQLLDGSGLSTRNYFPASFMTALLRNQVKSEVFLATIPIAGRSGSMRNRLKGTAAEGRLYAKSGSLNGARCYAGYAFRADGQRLAFSIMINNYTAKGRDVSGLLNDFLLLLFK